MKLEKIAIRSVIGLTVFSAFIILIASGLDSSSTGNPAPLAQEKPAQKVSEDFAEANLAAVVTNFGGTKVDYDTNGDGILTGTDLDLFVKVAMAKMATTSIKYDFNKDGKCDNVDWMIIARYFHLRAPKAFFDVVTSGVIDRADAVALANAYNTKSTNLRYDLHANNAVVGFDDWALLVDYINETHNHLALYDFDLSTSSTGVLDHKDRRAIAEKILITPGIEADFNADGTKNLTDWRLAMRHFLPANTYDFNADREITDADLDIFQEHFQGSDPVKLRLVDLDSSGKHDNQDWRTLVLYLNNMGDPKALYDLDGNKFINEADVNEVANQIQLASVPGDFLMRYDYNADYLATVADWVKFLEYVNYTIGTPAILYNMNMTGGVGASDVNLIVQGLQKAVADQKYYYRYDFNGDGKNTFADLAHLRTFLVVNGSSRVWLDVNADGSITSADVTLVKSAVSGAVTSGWAKYMRYDLNADGVVNYEDEIVLSYHN